MASHGARPTGHAHADDAEGRRRVDLLLRGLRELGWTEGRNINFVYRWAGGDPARAKADAAELVSEKPDVIIANSTMALAAVWNETSTIPIVFLVVGDPIGQGFVSSLARPGGNITGFTAFEFATSAKWLELIKEIVPETRRVAFIFHPASGSYSDKFVQEIAPIASSSGIELLVSPTSDAAEIDHALAAVSGEPKGGLIVSPDGFTTSNRGRIISLAARYRLPAIPTDISRPMVDYCLMGMTTTNHGSAHRPMSIRFLGALTRRICLFNNPPNSSWSST
jgi:putative tryptophan/tyrosine transport system substrate-binding protein